MNKYQREIRTVGWVTSDDIRAPTHTGDSAEVEVLVTVRIDVYDVLKAFEVTCPAMAHAVKKCLAPGQRGVKSSIQDKQEAIASIERSIQMEETDV